MSNQAQVYAEVYAVLSVLGGEYIRKIPQNVLNIIADQRDKSYCKKIDENVPLEDQNLSKDATALLAVLKLDYWCETEEQKQELLDLLDKNGKIQSGQPLLSDDINTLIKNLRGLK